MSTEREVAVVTGAASGFGRALTEAFAQRGMDVVLLDRDGGRAEEAAASVADAVLAGEPYVITHGDLVDAVVARLRALRRAAEVARERVS